MFGRRDGRGGVRRVLCVATAVMVAVVTVAAPASAMAGTWTYDVSPTPVAPGETLTVSGQITGCDFQTPVGGPVLVRVYLPDDVTLLAEHTAIAEGVAANSFSTDFVIPADAPLGSWHVIVENLTVIGDCTPPNTKIIFDVAGESSVPLVSWWPVAVVLTLAGSFAGRRARRRAATAGLS